VIAVCFGSCAPDALPAPGPVVSHDFKKFERLAKLATSSMGIGERTSVHACARSPASPPTILPANRHGYLSSSPSRFTMPWETILGYRGQTRVQGVAQLDAISIA
jgi:hypothetical protein